jgi:hypothetical protein
LRARRPHSRAATPVENLELDAGGIDGARHQSTERVYLRDEMPLGRPADRGVAGHVRDSVVRQRANGNTTSQACGRIRRLTPSMPCANHDDVKLFSHKSFYVFTAGTPGRRVSLS